MSRSRQRLRTDVPQKTVTERISGGTPFVAYSQNHVSFREFEAMVDFSSPDYIERAAAGALMPVNYLDYTCQTTIETPGQMIWWDQSGARKRSTTGCVTQFLYGTPSGVAGAGFTKLNCALPPSFSLSSMVAEAKALALERFAKPESSYGEPIATVAQTLRTIKDPLHTIRRIVSRFSNKRKSYKNSLKASDLADLWLGYSVNAGPNMRLIDDAVNDFAERNYKRFEQQKVFAKQVATLGPLRNSGLQTPSLGGLKIAERLYRVEVKAGIYYLNLEACNTMEKLGVSRRHLPGLSWELIPLSFMIDRLWNVKRFLNVSTALVSNSLSIKSGFVTIRITDTYKRRVVNLTVSGSPNPAPRDSPPLTEITFGYSRDKWTPVAFDVVPPFKGVSLVKSIHSTLDLVSLAIGRLT